MIVRGGGGHSTRKCKDLAADQIQVTQSSASVRSIPPPRAFKLEHDLLASLFILWTGCGLLKLPLVKDGCLQHVSLCANTTCIPFDCTAAILIDVPIYPCWTERCSFGKPWILQKSSSVVEVLACPVFDMHPNIAGMATYIWYAVKRPINLHLRRSTETGTRARDC